MFIYTKMTCIVAYTTGTAIPIGTPVVINLVNSQAHAYDDQTDDISQVIGVVYPNPNDNNGRAFNRYDGTPFYDLDYYLWGDSLVLDLNGQGQPQENPNYAAWNPSSDPSSYCFILIAGMAPIDVSYTSVPASWVKVRDGLSHNLYIIR